jgi:hypothetical protein
VWKREPKLAECPFIMKEFLCMVELTIFLDHYQLHNFQTVYVKISIERYLKFLY